MVKILFWKLRDGNTDIKGEEMICLIMRLIRFVRRDRRENWI